MAPQEQERVLGSDAGLLGEDALGLFDDDPAVEGVLELLGHGLGPGHRPLPDQPDRGGVGQRLPETPVLGGEDVGFDVEQGQDPDDLVPELDGQGVERPEPGLGCAGDLLEAGCRLAATLPSGRRTWELLAQRGSKAVGPGAAALTR